MRVRTFWLLLTACIVLSFATLAYPLYVIRPFRHQGERELALALQVLRFRPVLEIASALAVICALVLYWRFEQRRLRKWAAVAGVLLVCVFAGLSRINVYELMFHPLQRPSFSAASDSKLDGAEMVIAVRVGGIARAYPIRSMSYHHIVNDTLGGQPIVATY